MEGGAKKRGSENRLTPKAQASETRPTASVLAGKVSGTEKQNLPYPLKAKKPERKKRKPEIKPPQTQGSETRPTASMLAGRVSETDKQSHLGQAEARGGIGGGTPANYNPFQRRVR